ncbi:MAG: basic amino acid ABC transporter substrate-binding protein [Kyrpidia tusciae]|nr:basic amino acid ABC transporter substrate-binding protein [Kyrpidia tusciae]MBE3552568.1 basic amino acid ABC transporter substrate-binding protein [Kyrpidia tusciae]
MRDWVRKGWAGVAALALGIALAGCGASSSAPSGASSTGGGTNNSSQVYVVGTDAAYAPFESVNPQTNQIEGFDIDLLNAVAKAAGFQVKFENTPWKGIFQALSIGQRDILISAITITDERKQSMDFSNPYFQAQQMIVVPPGSPIRTLQDLKGKKVGVQTGTTGDEIVTDFLGKTDPNIKRYDTTPLALEDLKNKGVDAVVADNGVVLDYIRQNSSKGFEHYTDPKFPKEYYGIAVKKGNTALLEKINDGLAKVKSDGTYDTIYKQYFGSAPPAE